MSLKRALDSITSPRILIVGDLILDRYVTGEVSRISPEAPIPVLAARHTEERLGGAGNVAANLHSLGAQVEVIGVVGSDALGHRLLQLLHGIDVQTDGCVHDPDRPTTEKTRMISGVHQLVRIDWEKAHAVAGESERQLVDAVRERVPGAAAVVLSDYGKGVLTPEVLRAAIDAARAAGVPVLVDPKGTDYTRYRGATLVTPNRKEAEEAVGRKLVDLADVSAAASELVGAAELGAAVITLGADGMFFHSTLEGEPTSGRVGATARAVFDVTGAGDTVIAVLALVLGAGLDLATAVQLANHAAGLVVGQRGAASVTREELAAAFGQGGGPGGKILRREDVVAAVADWRARGKRIVFTNGCFDLLHVGHVEYLRFARSRGDVLLVGVNDDDSVRRQGKGPERPFVEIADRITVLAALEMVDGVVPFSEDTPQALIEEVTPDVLVKGEDWSDKGIVGREWVERHGGEVHLAPLVAGRSTTALAERLRASKG